MSKEIFLPYGVSGLTNLYASIRRPTDGWRWYTVTPTFEAYVSGHVANGYAIALTEEGTTGNYYADFPTGIAAAGRYEVVARKQAGGSPAWPTDTIVGTESNFQWSGSAVVVPVAADVNGRAPVSIGTGAGQINAASGKVPSTVASGDDADAASVKTTLGTAGAGLTALGDARITRLDVAVSTRSTYAGGAVASVTGNVGGDVTGNVNGSVGSVAGNVVGSVGSVLTGVDLATWLGAVPNALQSGRVDSYVGQVATGLGTPVSTFVTAFWTDTTSTDFTVPGSPGRLLMGQLAGAFTGTGSVYTTAALINAPTGGGGGASLTDIQGELDTRGLTSSLTTTITTNLNATVSSRSTFAGLGSTAPAGWINTAAFASGTTLPVVTSVTNLVTANTTQFGGHAVNLDANFYPGVNIVDLGGAAANPSSGAIPANITQVAGQTASAAGPVAFPASIGTSTYAGGAVASVNNPVTVGTNNDKAGYLLTAAGLDAISIADPGAVSGHTSLPKLMVALYRRFYRKALRTPNQITTYADNGITVNTTQAVSDDGAGNESQGAAT